MRNPFKRRTQDEKLNVMTRINYVNTPPEFQVGHWYKIGDMLTIAVHDDFLKTRLVLLRDDGTAAMILESAIPYLRDRNIREVDVEINVIVNVESI